MTWAKHVIFLLVEFNINVTQQKGQMHHHRCIVGRIVQSEMANLDVPSVMQERRKNCNKLTLRRISAFHRITNNIRASRCPL
jgi:hypothetical protein